MARRVTCILPALSWWSAALAQGAIPGAARPVEVVGPAAVPSHALLEQVQKGEDAYLLFDVGYGVRRAVVGMHEDWGRGEHLRGEGLRQLTAAMRARLADAVSPTDLACAGVAATASELLACDDRDAPPTGNESAEVWRGGAGTMRFLPGAPACDWEVARPRGGYAGEVSRLSGLFRATVYLATYQQRWPPETAARWRELMLTCRRRYTARDLATAAAEATILFGATLDQTGMPVPAPAADLAWLRAQADATDEPRARLRRMFLALAGPEPRAMSDGVLQLCRTLATATCGDPMLGELTPAQWRAKWSDAASFAYIGLREVDGLMRAVGREHLPPARVLVEPLPEVWRALRWLDLRHHDHWRVRHPEDNATHDSWVDPVLTALAVQARGEEIDARLNDELVRMLLEDFEEPDHLCGTPTTLDGIAGDLRRADPQLVRVPVRWRGEVVRALALRVYVEHHDEKGAWQPPPWGVALEPDSAAAAFADAPVSGR